MSRKHVAIMHIAAVLECISMYILISTDHCLCNLNLPISVFAQLELEQQKIEEEQENTPEFVKMKSNLRRTKQETDDEERTT